VKPYLSIFLSLPRVRAYGPGIEPTGPVVGAPANFTVETFSAGKGEVAILVDGPKGEKLPVSWNMNHDQPSFHSSFCSRFFPMKKAI
jgi:hypothetical protein